MRPHSPRLARLAHLLPLFALAGCATPRAASPSSQAAATPTVAAVDSARSTRPALPFITDDYDRALAEARASGKPIFVDAWAPW